MSNHEPARRLALQAAAAKKLVRCEIESAQRQSDGVVRVVVSGALDIDVEGAVVDGHNRDDVSSLVSDMRLQVDIKDGQIIQQQWLR